MKEIIFTEDFATRKKGDKWVCDGQLANHLVTVDKVAKYTAEIKVEKEVKKTAK